MFTSGISEPVFNLMQRLLQQERTLLIQPDVIETDYIYERPDEGNYRVTAVGDESAMRVINSGTKTKRNDLLLTGLQNDTHLVARLSVSTELEDEEKPETIAINWTMSRRKIRSTFTNTGTAHIPPTPDSHASAVVVPWRLDLTRVETTRAMRLDTVQFDPPIITFEVELEMPPLYEQPEVPLKAKVIAMHDGVSLLMAALGYANRNSEGPVRWTAPSHLAHPLPPSSPLTSHTPISHSQHLSGPSSHSVGAPLPPPSFSPVKESPRSQFDPNRNPDFPHMVLERVANVHPLRQAFDRCFKDHPQFDSPTRFLGTMPINFARRHIHLVRQRPYWISEKTDGVRFMFFISRAESLSSSSNKLSSSSETPLPSLYLIDRTNNFFRVPALQHFAATVSPNQDTLLDGELVKRHDMEKYYFLIFDAIALDGQRLWHLSFGERLSHIGSVVRLFEQYSEANSISGLPFVVKAKEIVPKMQLGDVRGKIEMLSNGESIYKSASLCHLTDGLIFMPDGIYPLFTCQNMYKWKFVDRQTIDFEIVFPSSSGPHGRSGIGGHGALDASGGHGSTNVELYIGGNSNSLVLIKTTPLPHDDFAKLQQDVKTSMRPNLVVAEMGFEPATGLWRYHKLRPDKDRPNYISIAMDTMESIAENITLGELDRSLA